MKEFCIIKNINKKGEYGKYAAQINGLLYERVLHYKNHQ
jgi:hypothetical protein